MRRSPRGATTALARPEPPRARNTAPAPPPDPARTRTPPSPPAAPAPPPPTRSAPPACRCPPPGPPAPSAPHGARPDPRWGSRPAGSPPRRAAPGGRAPPARACTRSLPLGSAGSVSTAMPPAPRTTSAISGSAHAAATGPIAADRARSSTCSTIARPAMGASGLPGRREEPMRDGMTTIGFKEGVRGDCWRGSGCVDCGAP